jgi:hypothetical protein
MPVSRPLVAAAIALTIGVSAAAAIESVDRIAFLPRPLQGEAVGPPSPSPFALRMVDTGGIGIPFDERWGDDYSHDRRTFREVIRKDPPYIDSAAFKRVELEWRAYVDRMRGYGNNAVAGI